MPSPLWSSVSPSGLWVQVIFLQRLKEGRKPTRPPLTFDTWPPICVGVRHHTRRLGKVALCSWSPGPQTLAMTGLACRHMRKVVGEVWESWGDRLGGETGHCHQGEATLLIIRSTWSHLGHADV